MNDMVRTLANSFRLMTISAVRRMERSKNPSASINNARALAHAVYLEMVAAGLQDKAREFFDRATDLLSQAEREAKYGVSLTAIQALNEAERLAEALIS